MRSKKTLVLFLVLTLALTPVLSARAYRPDTLRAGMRGEAVSEMQTALIALGYLGGTVDLIMMRVVDIIYTVPDVLIIILLAQTLKYPLRTLGEMPGFSWIQKLGPNMVSMFIVFALLYWVGMARIIRSQIMVLKQNEYVTAAKALGASGKRIIGKHLITNCIGTLIVTTTLQIPSSIFTESFLSFLGLGVQAPMPSLGSLASAALNGFQTFPEKLFAPAFLIFIIILSFNLLGDGLRDAFDPKLKS